MKRRLMMTLYRAAAVTDREPVATILFGVTCAVGMVILALAYNTVVPAYQ